jgi:hypothetical protein
MGNTKNAFFHKKNETKISFSILALTLQKIQLLINFKKIVDK